MMHLNNPEDAMPWVGLYVCVASLVCTLAMAADAFQGFRQKKLWFPCRFFTLNAASITVIAIAMKLPVDLTTIKPNLSTDKPDSGDVNVKTVSIVFLITMLANFLPSLGLMNDRELLFNILALGIFVITIIVNVCIQMATNVFYVHNGFNLVPLLFAFSIALTVPASRRILEHQYRELHELDSDNQEISFSKELVHIVKKYWMMAETGNPQFVIACSPISCAIGVVCLIRALQSCRILVIQLCIPSYYSYGRSDYKWSIKVIITVQLIGVLVGSIAPTFRCITSISYFNISKKWSVNHLNMFRVERQWTQRLQQWKRSHIHSHIPGRHCKITFHAFIRIILNFCIALQILFVIICKITSLVPKSFLIIFSCGWYFFKFLLKRFKKEPNVSNTDANSEMKEYRRYVLQIEDDAEFSERVIRNTLNSIAQILQESKEKESRNLLKFLQKSTSFDGVKLFHNDQVPPLHSEETKNSWSLVTVTLTAIALALPNIANSHVEGLLASMKEGLQFVRHVEESLNVNTDLVKARKAAKSVWTEVEVYRTWLQIDLQKKAHRGRKSKEILQWLGDEAVKIVIQFKSCKKRSLDHSLYKFLVAGSMYKISQSILLQFSEQENWPNDEEVFGWISNVITDVLCACFTNLPRVIKMKCHHDAIEKRGDSICSAAQLLGKSKKILKILKARQLPNLDMDSMAYIDKWHASPGCTSNRVQLASVNSDESLIVSIMK